MNPVRIALLGGFAVRGEAPPPPVRGLIPQAVIARLAVARGDFVGADAIVTGLWADPPAEVLSSLRAHVSRLRSRGWQGFVTGGREGYRLDPAVVDVDAWEFVDLVEGRAGGDLDRADALDRALGLWRPDPLNWARSFPFAGPFETLLTRTHRTAVLARANLRLLAGDPARAVTDLTPLHEDLDVEVDDELAVLRARALAASGRPADALAALAAHTQRARAAGAGASAAVETLRDQIIRHAPVVGTAVTAPDVIQRIGIPEPRSALVGRAAELEAIAVGRAASRLVTITGTAGVGKTRLAVEAAYRSEIAADEVQWLVDLTAAAAAGDVLTLLAEVLGAGEASVDAVARLVGGRRALVIFDNCEHVLGAVASACASLLGACAGLGIVVTSRESLRMAGERVIAVAPLVGAHLDDAVELFLQRAAEVSGVHRWSPDQTLEIARLCRALDGLPLAIELAASRLDALDLAELSASLGARGEPPPDEGRHASVDAAIAWSVRLITPAERALLDQLAGFAGPFTLEAVAEVCVVEGHDARQLAASLARKSLVDTLSGVGERRFRLLEAVRQHVRRTGGTVRDGWDERHARWCAAAVRRAAARLTTPDARSARVAVRSWRADIDQALTWSMDAGHRDIAVAVLAALGPFWSERRGGPAFLDVLDRALALPGTPVPDDDAAALQAATFVAALGSDPVDVVRRTRRFAAAAAAAPDPRHAMMAAAMSAYLAVGMGDAAEGDRLLAEGEYRRGRIDPADPAAEADYLTVRGDVLRAAGRPAQALAAFAAAARLVEGLSGGWAYGAVYFLTGKTLIGVGRSDEALGVLRTAVIRRLEGDDVGGALAAATAGAVALAALGRSDEAVELFAAVSALGERHGYDGGAVDPDFAGTARADLERVVPGPQRAAAAERGRTRDLRWIVDALGR